MNDPFEIIDRSFSMQTNAKVTRTATIKSLKGTFTKEEIVNFLGTIPDGTEIRVNEAKSYPREQGSTPATISATWSE